MDVPKCKQRRDQIRVGLEIYRRNRLETAPNMVSLIGESALTALRMRNDIATILDRAIIQARMKTDKSVF